MVTLTEKEITINGTGCTIELFAEYSDDKVTDIYALLDIDGNRMGKSPGILIYDGLKFTSFYVSLQLCLDNNTSRELFNQVNNLIKG